MSTYEGYVNYPTWAMSLWIADEEGLYEMVREYIEEYNPDTEELAKYIEDLMTDPEYGLATELPHGPQSDVCDWAMEQVDWGEVAHEQFEE